MTTERYYDWQKTLSYDAPVTMIISARGIGKTYGMRRQFIHDYLAHGWRFADISRYDAGSTDLQADYFDKVGREQYPDIAFKCEGGKAYMARDPKHEQWELFGYFLAMTQFQRIKRQNFANVKRLMLDECVLEKMDKHHTYLPDEWKILTSIVDSVTREHADSTIKPRLYLCGNACDILNPYFEAANISGEPPRGYSWHRGKTMLVHYDDTRAYAKTKAKTLAGRMGDNDTVSALNSFETVNSDIIASKSERATHLITLAFGNRKLGIWVDTREGLYYATTKTPKDNRDTYALMTETAPNYPVIRRTHKLLKALFEAYNLRYMRFDAIRTHGLFADIMRWCGWR